MAATLCTTPSGQSRKRSYLGDTPPSCKRLRPQFSSEAALTRLRQLFPHMDDTTLSNVLDSCAHNIDLAVEQLSALHLASATEPSGVSSPPRPATPEQPVIYDESSTNGGGPTTRPEWIGAFVTEMSRSRDVGDAHERASRALAAFEAFIVSRCVTKDNSGKLERENGVLKRAVAIQAARLNEAADTVKKQAAHVCKLEQLAREQCEKLKQAEHTNYSLSVHLRQATEQSQFGGVRSDVY